MRWRASMVVLLAPVAVTACGDESTSSETDAATTSTVEMIEPSATDDPVVSATDPPTQTSQVDEAPPATELPPTTTTPSAASRTTEASVAAACTSDVILPVVAAAFPDNEFWNVLEVAVHECRNGYARVIALPDQSVCDPESPNCLENEQVFLVDVDGTWHYLEAGTGIECNNPSSLSPEVIVACEALGLTTSSSSTTTTTLPVPTSPLPENLLPGTDHAPAPEPGAELSVVGVRYDDVLNVRQAPGANHAVIARIAPVAENIAATGGGRMLTQSVWWEVTTEDGLYGWVSARFTARGGATTDWTSVITGSLGGIPEDGTMEALGEVVAAALAPGDPDGTTSIVMVAGPTIDGPGEVTFDVVGLNDVDEHALRAHVVGQPIDGGFSLLNADVAVMCVSTGDPPAPDPDGHQPWRLFCLSGDA